MRQDLQCAAYAVALGYSLVCSKRHSPSAPEHFDAQGIPHNALSFEADRVAVWLTARGWRVAQLVDGRFTPPRAEEFHKRLAKALQAGARLEGFGNG